MPVSSRQLLYGFDDHIAAWTAERILHVGEKGFGLCAAIGVATNSRIIAGVVYHDYQPDFGSIQISMAADSPIWARKEIIGALLAYPFVQLGCWSVFTLTPASNEKALKVNAHIGIERKTILPHAFGKGIHGVFCQMLQPAYVKRYGDLNGQKEFLGARCA